MSTVERAIKKLWQAGATGDSRVAQPIGSVGQGSIDQPQGVRDFRSRRVQFDLDVLRDAGLVSTDNNNLADEYRSIKQPILRSVVSQSSGKHERANLVMIGSAISGEGKTFTSVNLSLSLAAEKDWDVLLVDVDCRNPQLSRLLGVMDEPGLLDFLREPTLSINSLVMPTSIDRLSVLPLGQTDDLSSELLGSSRMGTLCDELSNPSRRQIVVFDSSPLLLTTEAPILAAHVGQIVVVVRANSTPRQVVRAALEKLDASQTIGLLLNQAHESGPASGYGGYHSYAYARN